MYHIDPFKLHKPGHEILNTQMDPQVLFHNLILPYKKAQVQWTSCKSNATCLCVLN